jgi:hypothetical protein
MRHAKKNFDYREGAYYFNIKNGFNSAITIRRLERPQAIEAFRRYLKAKKECEWLGKWNGSEFEDANFEKLAAA